MHDLWKVKEYTLIIHHRQRRHPPLHKYGEGVVKRRRLVNGGDVPERPDPQLLDLPPDERRLGRFFTLKKTPRNTRVWETQRHHHIEYFTKYWSLPYEYVEELEDSFVGEDVQDASRLRVDDGQPVDLVYE